MIDIETLGLTPGCVVLSIGAVKFDSNGLGDELYRSINFRSCCEAGLDIEPETLDWWLEQDETVRAAALEGGVDLSKALSDFVRFYDDERVWANSPAFDCVILKAAYDAADIAVPWRYHNERCFRTLKDLNGPVDVKWDGDGHHALDDARNQARIASKLIDT